jgi:pyruvate dehydrogenase E1 component alpha subunit
LAAQVRGNGAAAIAVFGDGSANIGAFHEALNLASIWKLPVVFVCENNLYGEYTRLQLTTPVEDIARRAEPYAMPGLVVDGQDVDAVAEAMGAALERARRGEGPSLLEMKTYRYSGHSRSDAGDYRPAGELDAWKQRDPIAIYATRLVERGAASEEDLATVRARLAESVERAAQAALASPEPAVGEMFRHVLASGAGALTGGLS